MKGNRSAEAVTSYVR